MKYGDRRLDDITEAELQGAGAVKVGCSGVGPMYRIDEHTYIIKKETRRAWYAFETKRAYTRNE